MDKYLRLGRIGRGELLTGFTGISIFLGATAYSAVKDFTNPYKNETVTRRDNAQMTLTQLEKLTKRLTAQIDLSYKNKDVDTFLENSRANLQTAINSVREDLSALEKTDEIKKYADYMNTANSKTKMGYIAGLGAMIIGYGIGICSSLIERRRKRREAMKKSTQHASGE